MKNDLYKRYVLGFPFYKLSSFEEFAWAIFGLIMVVTHGTAFFVILFAILEKLAGE